MTLSVVMPAYLEAENLKNIIPLIHSALRDKIDDYEIIAVDTVEPMDNTSEVCQMNGAVCVSRRGGNSYGDAIRTGIESASGKYLVIMDADGSHNPQDILRFYKEATENGFDLVIGSRYCKNGKTDNNFILRFMSYILNIMYRILFGLKVKDVSDSYRLYNSEKLRSITLECVNFDIVEEILIKLNYEYKDFRIKEVPISFSKRAAGESKRDLKKFIVSYLKTIKRLMKIKKEAKKKRKA